MPVSSRALRKLGRVRFAATTNVLTVPRTILSDHQCPMIASLIKCLTAVGDDIQVEFCYRSSSTLDPSPYTRHLDRSKIT